MRGNRVGGGDIDEVPRGKWCTWHSPSCDDGRSKGRKRNTGLVDGRSRNELDSSQQSGRDGLGIDDGARLEHGAFGIHGTCSRGPDGMRGDRVGVGDVGTMPDGSRVSRHSAGSDDCRRTRRKLHASLVGGYCRIEHNTSVESRQDGLGISHSAGCEHGTFVIYGSGSSGTNRMRGNRVGVRDVGEVSCGSRIAEHSQDCHVHLGACRQRVTGLVSG